MSGRTKEIKQEITVEEYEYYHGLETVFDMREEIMETYIAGHKRRLWYGCRLEVEEIGERTRYYIVHRVAKEWID